MLKYLASKNGEELKGVYFNTTREALDYLHSNGYDINDCSITPIDLGLDE